MGNLLNIEKLQAWYGKTQVLFNVNLTVQAGEVVALMGRNGVGKTSTINAVCGLLEKREGVIEFQGSAVGHLPSYKVARRGIGLVPEGRRIFPNLSVAENLLASATDGEWGLERVHQLFPRLLERRKQSGATLSGGEQQMLAIGRALMTNPALLILDEATEGLAPIVRQEIWAAIHTLKSSGMSILLVDKTLKEMMTVVDRCYMLERGEAVWSGDVTQLDEQVAHTYLGV